MSYIDETLIFESDILYYLPSDQLVEKYDNFTM